MLHFICRTNDSARVRIEIVDFHPAHFAFSARPYSLSDMRAPEGSVRADSKRFWRDMFEGNEEARDYYFAIVWTASSRTLRSRPTTTRSAQVRAVVRVRIHVYLLPPSGAAYIVNRKIPLRPVREVA